MTTSEAGPSAALAATPPARSIRRNPYLGVLLAILAIVGAVWLLENSLADDEDAALTSQVSVEGGGVTPRIGEPSPDFTLDGLDGRAISLSDYRGRPVLVNFWASWCPPCRGEMPDLEEIQREYGADGLVVLAVNLREEPTAAQRYAETLGLTFPIVLDRSARAAARYNVTGLPMSYFVGRDGVIRDLNVGALTGRALRGKIARIV